MDLTIFLKSQEKTDIDTKSNQNAYEMYKLVNLQNLIDEENWKKCWIMSVAMQRQKLMGVASTHSGLVVFFRLRNEGIYSFFQNRQNLTFWLLRNLSTAVCAGSWANCDYIPENYPRLHRGLFCAALTMYAGASSHSHFTFPAAVKGSSLRGGESIGKWGNSVMSKLYFTSK